LVCQRFFGIGFSFRGCIGRFVVEKRGYLRADLIAGIEDGDGLVGFAVEGDEQMGGDGGVGGFLDFGISGFVRFGFGFGFRFRALFGGRRRVWRRASGRSAASCFGHYGRFTILNNGIRFWEARDVALLMMSVASTNRSEMRCQRQVM